MGETTGPWGVELETAWGAFRLRMRQRLALLSPDEVLRIEGATDDATPYLRFVGLAHGEVLGEVFSDLLIARRHLDSSAPATLATLSRLSEIGWTTPQVSRPGARSRCTAGLKTYDALTRISERALREVFDVLHPAFLDDAVLDPASGSATPRVQAHLGAEAISPASREELLDLVDAALHPLLGDLRKDATGDVVVVAGESVVHVQVLPDGSAVDVFSVLVREVADPARALAEVNILNREVGGPTYIYRHNQVAGRQRFPARPFMPRHLCEAVAGVVESVDELAGDLVGRIGGSRCLAGSTDVEPAEASRSVPAPAATTGSATGPLDGPGCEGARESLRTLMHLEADQPGSVDAELAAHIFDHDDHAILSQISRLRLDGRVALVPLLRRALRVAVESGARERTDRR